jgi:hypothetical protein
VSFKHLLTDAAQVARGLAMPDYSPDPAGSETPGRVIFAVAPQPVCPHQGAEEFHSARCRTTPDNAGACPLHRTGKIEGDLRRKIRGSNQPKAGPRLRDVGEHAAAGPLAPAARDPCLLERAEAWFSPKLHARLQVSPRAGLLLIRRAQPELSLDPGGKESAWLVFET